MGEKKHLVALLTNNDDDIYCFRKELISAIIEAGYRILISCPYGPKFELMKDVNYIYDNPKIDRRGTNPYADFRLLMHYRKLFKQYRPSIILTYTAKPNVYASIAARQLGIPYINNLTGFGSVLNLNTLMKKLVMHLFKFAYNGAACIMFQNATNMQLAKEMGFIKAKARLIPGSGVALNRFPIQKYPEGGNGKEGEKVIFNYIGRILHDKGVDDYIEAAKQIRSKYPQTEFNMIGFIEPTENHYEQELRDLGKKGIIYYHGSQKDVTPFIARSHATIHPSTYGEGMSNVLLESAASARPLITTNNPGCQETVNNGKSGYIYQGGNIEQLVMTIEKFLSKSNEERKAMGLVGRKKIEAEFSREIVIKVYLEEINKIVK